ncbi:transcription factor AP-4 isoform X2 [Cimex lectularius]|uniref:BHLH domain-containing protein n=1 Tax=Cimex lectularius TaxID=79782 RepID=A0A8I6RPP5_CIMLE|nr:transcription factor AP-4 isoform X2 [Cimex lectularius]
MASLGREEKIRIEDIHQYEEDISSYCSLSGERSESPVSARVHHNGSSAAGAGMEQEKRIRREIANSNERRRMQSINAGFQSLRTLLPHHEGEKLSKAAILQQTAEYIYQLEQEKTRLLSQNCHLKRLLNQHEGEASANKKRKTDSGLVVTVSNPICESGDEGADIVAVAQPTITPNLEVDTNVVSGATNDLIDVRVQLDRERRLRMILEEQVRSLESQLYPERIREITQQVQLQYQQREEEENGAVITPMRREVLNGSAETVAAVANLQVVSANSLQPVAHTETVIATVTNSPPNSPSSRLPSILEAAIKAEPKVEVERLPSPHAVATTQEERMSQARVYLASTSRQNLETIVEAIRHLEGDNLFSDSVNEGGSEGVGDEPQEAPLALTKHTSPEKQQLIKVKMNQYLQFQQQQRPGVIVVKQHT